MSRVAEVLKRIFIHNWKMKLLALAFAFVLWSFMIADTNPPTTKEFKDIPVTFTAADELRQKGYTTSVSLSELLQTVTVKAEAKADAVQYMNSDMFKATVDLSSINGTGEYTLPVEAATTFSSATNVTVEPSSITITVEDIVSRDVPVEVQYTGEEKDWLYYGDPVLSTSSVEVTGARSNVEKVARAVCYINVDSIEEATKNSYRVTLVNSDGSEMDSNMFSGLPSVIVELPIYPQKEVPVDTSTIINTATGIAQGYEISNVAVEPASIKIAGKMEDIEGISMVSLEPVALDNATGDTIVEANVLVPDGVIAVVPSKVQVQFTIAQPQLTRTYESKRITAQNLGDGLSYTIEPSSVTVTAAGTEEAFRSFSSSDIAAFVNLEGLGRGVHDVPVKFENEADFQVKLTSSSSTVKVTIT